MYVGVSLSREPLPEDSDIEAISDYELASMITIAEEGEHFKPGARLIRWGGDGVGCQPPDLSSSYLDPPDQSDDLASINHFLMPFTFST